MARRHIAAIGEVIARLQLAGPYLLSMPIDDEAQESKMADKDDIESELRRAGDDAKDVLEHTSGAAMEAVQRAAGQTADVTDRLTEAPGRAKERAARRVHVTEGRLQGKADDLSSTASQLYDRAGKTVHRIASAPMAAILVAGLFGVLVGWALRGSAEADTRADVLSRLPRYWRNRLEP
jgi:ElaB/YqjD/DUF883 family membrane-anchored ribosome-binding protein